MKKIGVFLLFVLPFVSCKTTEIAENETEFEAQLTLAFGSCNRQDSENLLWDDVLEAEPAIWIWGGDNIYADTADMEAMGQMYALQSQVPGYRKLARKIPVVGTWDDHDYGINDGGTEFAQKKGSQQAFLDFMGVSEDSPRRTQKGIYTSHAMASSFGSVKIIVLDTRYFRTGLTQDEDSDRRYKPNAYGEGTLLGEEQWAWLEKELRQSEHDFNLVVSSIQLVSGKHGFECWANFPHELDRFTNLIGQSNAKGVLLLTGDRHISEFSKINVSGLSYPLIDFTSSGLTHAYEGFSEEYNPQRIGRVVSSKSFGLVKINFVKKAVRLQMVGDEGQILQELEQSY